MKEPKCPAGLSGLTTNPRARLEHVIFRRDVMAVVAIGLLNAAAVDHVHAAQSEAHAVAALHDGVEHMTCHVGRHVDLPPELADIADAVSPCQPHADLHRARGEKGKASLDRSASTRGCSSSGERGPITARQASLLVTSVATHQASSGPCRL